MINTDCVVKKQVWEYVESQVLWKVYDWVSDWVSDQVEHQVWDKLFAQERHQVRHQARVNVFK
jgi:hypothetical protein